MATLPQLIEEDIQRFGIILQELLKHTEAATALVIDKGGFLITHQGNAEEFDLTTIAALASGSYLANQTIANLVHETNFNSVYQQGEKYSIYATAVGDECLLVVIFEAEQGVGLVKYFAEPTAVRLAEQLKAAHEREPGEGLDLSILNVADTSGVFKKKGRKRSAS